MIRMLFRSRTRGLKVIHLIAPTALFFALGFALGVPTIALAETTVVIGADGVAGTEGAVGAPGLPAGDGSAGDSASAIANLAGEDNTAEALGGAGGGGGNGGDATAGSGTEGGRGGDSGAGGDAFAESTTTGASLSHATATGGAVGPAGLGGAGSAPGVDGERGGISGEPGRATATAYVERSFTVGDGATGLDAAARAYAGAGGNLSRASAAGEASAAATGIATGTGDPTAEHKVWAFAEGTTFDGSFAEGRLGADARADATGEASHGSLDVRAGATGGHHERAFTTPLSLLTNGGGAAATASGTLSGGGDLSVGAGATSYIGEAGSVSASAEGYSSGNGTVTVSAGAKQAAPTGSDPTILRDAVRGGTGGKLVLSQRLTSVSDAITSLDAENAGGGSLDVSVEINSAIDTWIFAREPNFEGGRAIVGDVIGRSDDGPARSASW